MGMTYDVRPMATRQTSTHSVPLTGSALKGTEQKSATYTAYSLTTCKVCKATPQDVHR